MKIMTNLHRLTLFDEIISKDNILKSIYQKTSNKSKISRAGYDTLKLFSDIITDQLHWLLHRGLYFPAFKQFTLYDRKRRLIISPHTENSIVQRAIYQIIREDFFNHFSPKVHSCIEGRSVLTASKQIRKNINKLKFHDRGIYYLKTDFSNFFGSINSHYLFEKLNIHIKDQRVMNLLSLYVFFSRGATGIPFGNLLSQLFGNFYVTELDFELTGYAYTRYADDIIVIGDLKRVKTALDIIKDYCYRYNLTFSKEHIGKVRDGFKFLGRKHFLDYHILSNRHVNTRWDVYNNLNRQNKSHNKIPGINC